MDTVEPPEPSLIHKFTTAISTAFLRVLHWRTILIWIACSAVASYSGPFGTYQNYSPYELAVTWFVLIGAGILVAYITHELCSVVLPSACLFVKTAVFFVVASYLIGTLNRLLLIFMFERSALSIPSAFQFSLYAFLAMCFIFVIREAYDRRTPQDVPDARVASPKLPAASLPKDCRLARRLDLPQGTRIIQVTADGHFVEVQTCSKKYRTRMRFADAVVELDGTCGLMVHRSHWVHRDAIKGWVPSAKKPYVVLENEALIPVSKPHMSKVEAEGLTVLKDLVAAS